MGIDTQTQNGESYEESEVDLEDQYMVVVDKIEKCRKKKSFERETVKVPRGNKSNYYGLEEPASRGQED